MSVDTSRPGTPLSGDPFLKRWSTLHSYLLLSAAALLCLLPFSGRAFHVDDPLFVWTAQHIAQHPSDPYGFQIIWDFTQVRMSEVTQNPPLASYYAAMIGSVVGWSERMLHLGFLPATLALVLGTYRLAQGLTRSPLLAALATLLTPGVLVSASSVMCDTMMLAIWVWAAIFWIEGLEPRKPAFLVVSGLLVAASALTKYFGVSLILLLLAYSIVRLQRIGTYALYLLIPVAILCAYQLWTADLYGQGMLLGAAKFAGSQRAFSKGSLMAMGLVGLSYAGGCALPGLTFAPLVWSRKALTFGALGSCMATLAIWAGWLNMGLQLGGEEAVAARHSQPLLGSQLFFCIAAGTSVLAIAIRDLWEERNAGSLFLALWVLGTFFFAAFINYTVNARSVLPLVPAVGILLARRFDNFRPVPSRILAVRVALALLVSGFFALWIATADAELANSARTAAAVCREKTRGKGRTLWFEGHWGFQYYMQLLGAHPLDMVNPQARPGDFVVIPYNNIQLRDIPHQLVLSQESFELLPDSWETTMSSTLGAGFYSSYWGPLPYAIGRVPPEHYLIVQLAPASPVREP